ncbi:hypothetical protein GR210_29635 [Rhizobium leguminosarum]|uniref:hypothetical protein n=1 Tax=Rhizobium leguminosarum TaxID=384 RepID=UPI0013D951C8|nr:hypothetical protein [Rhizobium leguminosarum]NEH52937.1 hypothetical protein [Rhizobium leguminosarum]
MATDKEFWRDEREWPDDAYGYVFLARALHIVGIGLYGEAWTRREPLTPPLFDLWNEVAGRKGLKYRSSIGASTEIELLKLLRKHAPDKVELEDEEVLEPATKPLITAEAFKRYAAPRGSSRIVNKVMTAQTYRAAVEVAEEENVRRQAAQERLAAAQNALKAAMRDGKLKYVLLPLVGGRFSEPKPPEWWNRKEHDRIFAWCQMNPLNPFATGVGGDNFQHVFVDQDDLDYLIRALNFPKEDPLMLASSFDDLPDFSDPERAQDEWVQPDPADFAVMEMDDWTIEMVLAWIIWRDATEVVRFNRDYHKLLTSPFEAQFGSIAPPTLKGIQEQLDWYSNLKDGFGTPDRSYLTYNSALKELKSALRNELIVADGMDLHSMKSRTIGSDEWKRLNPVVGDGQAAILVNNFDVPIFGDILFERQQVVEKWPADDILRTNGLHDADAPSAQPPQTMIDRIRDEGGVAKLSGGERQIWDAIQAIGGESSLPARRADYIEAIRKAARGTLPSDSSIDRFFGRFKPRT